MPILAIAPMVVVGLGGRGLPGWFSVSVIAAYLTFFPVTINTLRGLHVGRPARARADALVRGEPLAVLWKLRVPASLPYLFAALKIAATASVVGAIIGELPSSIQDGLGGAILNFNQYYASSPENLWATNLIAALARDRVLPRSSSSSRSSSCDARRSTSHEQPQHVVVALKGVTKTFGQAGVVALEDIDLEVRPASSSR